VAVLERDDLDEPAGGRGLPRRDEQPQDERLDPLGRRPDGLDADLSAAVAFFREVEASFYLAEAEALLAKSRSA